MGKGQGRSIRGFILVLLLLLYKLLVFIFRKLVLEFLVTILPVEFLLLIGGPQVLAGPVESSPRIGITRAAEEPWRFYEVGPWASPLRSPPPPKLKGANILRP